MFGIGAYSWIAVGRTTDSLTWNAVSYLVSSALIAATNPRAAVALRYTLTRTSHARIILLGAISSVAAAVSFFAYRQGNASVIYAIGQSNVVLAVVLAAVGLSERDNLARKCMAAVLCGAGATLLTAF